ncbi:MAG: hypothetical protein K6B72_12880 [Lachnospiraceae bacterium]|nr:hypothetical protein [Lachnospiraceae bacterium]
MIKDYGVVAKLFFTHDGKDVEMAVRRSILTNESFEDVGRNMIESYVANLATHVEGRKLQLH